MQLKLRPIKDIRFLILAPIFFVLVVISVAVMIQTHLFVAAENAQILEDSENKNASEVANFLNRRKNDIVTYNYLIGRQSFIVRAYLENSMNNNTAATGEVLRDSMALLSDEIPNEQNFQYQFVNRSGVILYRSKDNSIGRYKSELEVSLGSALKDQVSYTGFEIGPLGLLLKSITPITVNEQELGAIEIQQDIKDLMGVYENESLQHCAFYIDLDFIPANWKTQLPYFQQKGENQKLQAIYNTIDGLSENDVIEDLDAHPTANSWSSISGDALREYYLIKDLNGSKIGYWVVNHELGELRHLQKGIDQLLKFILPLVVLLLIVSLFMVLTYMVHKPIRKVEKLLSGLLKGEKQEYPRIKQNPMLDHILQMLNSLEKRSEAISVFVKRIGSGNFELEHDHFEADDRLGKSLVEMSDKLMEIEQTALVQQEEEQKQNWIGSGIAQLNEILRDSSSDIETLTQNVLSFIVNYADMIQGAIYITSEESESESESGSLFLKLQAAYAYQQTRYIDKKFKIGEGPVGACAAEQSQIILSNIPADHLKIVSGLGSHTPFQILFEPLLMNNVLFGVLEISSLSEIPAYTIELITRSSGSLASAMANVRSSAKLKNLLREYEKTSARLSEQEETMRVNFENMLATQEASMHREREVTALFNSIDISIIRLEVNTGGMILNINHKFLEITGQLNEEVIGKQITAFVAFDSRDEVNTALQLCTNLESYSCELKFLGKFSIQTRARVVFSPIVDQDYAVPKIHIFGMTIQKEMVEG